MGSFLRLIRLLGLLLAIGSSCTETFSAKISAQEKAANQAVWLDWEAGPSSKEDDAERVTVKLIGADLTNLGAAQFELSFPADAWEFRSASAGPLLASALLESNLIEPGRVKVAFVSSESIDGTGTLIELAFRSLANQSSAESIRLENLRAWRQADSSDSTLAIRPSVGSTKTAGPLPAQPTEQAPAPVPAAAAPLNSPGVMPAPPPEFKFPEAFTVKLELPGWQWFVAGAFAGLLVGGLLGWSLRRAA